MQTPYNYRYQIFSMLAWCEERQDFFPASHRVLRRIRRPKSDAMTLHPWAEWMNMKRYMTEVQPKDKKWKQGNEPLLQQMPHIAQLLTDPWWDNGEPREVCSMTVKLGVDQCQISINDVANRQSASTTADTVHQALQLLEEALAAGRNVWRAWGGNGKAKRG